MQGETKQRWMLLCEQAAHEQDPQKMLQLIREINQLLERKAARIGAADTGQDLRSRSADNSSG